MVEMVRAKMSWRSTYLSTSLAAEEWIPMSISFSDNDFCQVLIYPLDKYNTKMENSWQTLRRWLEEKYAIDWWDNLTAGDWAYRSPHTSEVSSVKWASFLCEAQNSVRRCVACADLGVRLTVSQETEIWEEDTGAHRRRTSNQEARDYKAATWKAKVCPNETRKKAKDRPTLTKDWRIKVERTKNPGAIHTSKTKRDPSLNRYYTTKSWVERDFGPKTKAN